MKRPLPLILGLLALYILCSSLWYSRSACCAGSAASSATSMVENAAPAVGAAATATETNAVAAADANTELTLEERLRANSLVIYFATNEERLDLDEDQNNYLADLYTYLKDHESSNISVVGHTDSAGDADNNITISQNRADFVRSYLIANGIRPEQIESKGIGAEEPIADNDTEDGRAANRRVEIILQ